MDDSAWIFNVETAIELRTQKKIVAEAVGTLAHSSTQELVLGPPFLLSAEQRDYLNSTRQSDAVPSQEAATPSTQSVRSRVFAHFASAGYFVVSGAAYGCDFLLYHHDPLLTHAAALVFIERSISPARLVEITRIAALCKKSCLVAAVVDWQVIVKEITRVSTSHTKSSYQPRVRE